LNFFDFTLQLNIGVNGYLNLNDLCREVEELQLNKLVIEQILMRSQDEMIARMCGIKYNRNSNTYVRAGTRERTIRTKFGDIILNLIKIRSLETGEITTPLLSEIGIRSRQRYTEHLMKDCLTLASATTYRKASDEMKEIGGVYVPKTTIHRFVQEIGPRIKQKSETSVEKKQILAGDSTKAHGMNKKKNRVNIVIGIDPIKKEKTLVSASVNRKWSDIGDELKRKGIVDDKTIGLSDSDREIREALTTSKTNSQLCIVHYLRYFSYTLWQSGLIKEERDKLVSKMEGIIYTLKNSVKKHSDDVDAIKERVVKTKEEVRRVAKTTMRLGCREAADYISGSLVFVLTFALLAIEGVQIPYTNNMLERFIREMNRRIKKIGAHWSPRGLDNIVNIRLIRYTRRKVYDEFWEECLYSRNKKHISLRVDKVT